MRCRRMCAPILLEFYRQYLESGDIAFFVAQVREVYCAGTLERLSGHGSAMVRRAAVLALGMTAGIASNHRLAERLLDTDRTVAALAENALRKVWKRHENPAVQNELAACVEWLLNGEAARVVPKIAELIATVPTFAEAWNVRAQAWFDIGEFQFALDDCRQVLKRNPLHFNAAVLMGHACIELGDVPGALRAFRRALEINPGLRRIRQARRTIPR